jgi:TRAP-type C4-dicarboxylate transport system permease small subunit
VSSPSGQALAYKRLASNIFGVTMLALAVLVTLETILRKVFSISLGGVDELAGYSIAVGAPLCFGVALLERSHIRINIGYIYMPARLKAWLDFLSVLSIGVVALFLFGFTVKTVLETQAYQSIAQTPWATPLIYPQAVWLVGMLAFLLPAVWLPIRACTLLVRGKTTELTAEFGPDTPEDELKAELEDLRRR